MVKPIGPPLRVRRVDALVYRCPIESPVPLAQAIAGVDMALWDIAARRAGEPLWRFLGGASPVLRVYASGLNPEHPEALAAERHKEGFTAFRLKVGFGRDRDASSLAALRAALGPDVELMADAN